MGGNHVNELQEQESASSQISLFQNGVVYSRTHNNQSSVVDVVAVALESESAKPGTRIKLVSCV
jgi:hypothetical protein